MKNDNASQQVIGNTTESAKDYARFYFRPRTPTQYKNEGIRPKQFIESSAHCPVPVYFFVSAREVLTREETLFTEGNVAASGTQLRSTPEEFSNLPFDTIYHNSSMFGYTEPHKRYVIYHRHAEVLVPGHLDLDDSVLRNVWCRSPAELETLLNLLSPKARDRWGKIIGHDAKQPLFNGEWAYVDRVSLTRDKVNIWLNCGKSNLGPFILKSRRTNLPSGGVYATIEEGMVSSGVRQIRLSGDRSSPADYEFKFYIDDHLAYYGRYSDAENDLPF